MASFAVSCLTATGNMDDALFIFWFVRVGSLCICMIKKNSVQLVLFRKWDA
jgi:hypothetical protein